MFGRNTKLIEEVCSRFKDLFNHIATNSKKCRAYTFNAEGEYQELECDAIFIELPGASGLVVHCAQKKGEEGIDIWSYPSMCPDRKDHSRIVVRASCANKVQITSETY